MINILPTIRAQRIIAGTSRDGTAAARIDVLMAVIDAHLVAFPDLSDRRRFLLDTERDNLRVARGFCMIHDREARGDISHIESGFAMAALRERAA